MATGKSLENSAWNHWNGTVIENGFRDQFLDSVFETGFDPDYVISAAPWGPIKSRAARQLPSLR
jgi:hypothetical protein